MVITSESFENPPPSSLDPEASARVKKVTSKRDRRKQRVREIRASFETDPEKIAATQQIDELSQEAESRGGSLVLTAQQKVQVIGAQRRESVPTSTPTRERTTPLTPAEKEQLKLDTQRIIRREISRGVDITPASVARAKREIEERPLVNPAFDFVKDKTNTFIESRGEVSPQFKQFKTTFLKKPQEKIEKYAIIHKSKTEKSPMKNFVAINMDATELIAGAGKGVLKVADFVVNPQESIIPFGAAFIKEPLKTSKEVYSSLGTVGNKARGASTFQTGEFFGEVVVSAGGETLLFRNVLRPGFNFVSAATSPDFIPVKTVPATKTQTVKPFTRTITKTRTPGEPLPKEFVFSTDDYVVVESRVKGFERQVQTGETIRIIPDVPTSKKTLDIELVGGVASTEEALAPQFARAGEKRDIVSAQRGLIQPSDELFGGLTNKADFDINKPSSDPIERSLFFDPEGRLRQSRLGIGGETVEPNLMDLATEDFNTRPEILIKPDADIAQFPERLRKGSEFIKKEGVQRPGETAEAAVSRTRSALQKEFPGFEREITEFQLRTKGQATTPGFFSREGEVIFSEGQAGRGERIGVTFIGGKKVKIFEETKLGTKETTPPTITPEIIESVSDQFVRNIVEKESRPVPKVIESPASSGISSSLESPTTTSLTGLETKQTPIIQEKSSAPSSSLSRDFIPPSRPPVSSVSPTRKRINIEISSPIPRSPSRSRNRRISSSYSPISSPPSRITSSPRVPPSTPTRVLRTPSRLSPRTSRVTTTPSLIVTTPRFKSERSGSSFTTQVLKKGKFTTVGRTTTKKAAFSLGSRAVGGSADRSFRILKGGTPINLEGTGRFRRSKSKPFTVVEKSRFAINTPGEVFEISGASKRKRRRLF